MTENEKKLNQLQQLLKILQDGISKKEFISSFQSVIKQITVLKGQLIAKIDAETKIEKERLHKLQNEMAKVIEDAKSESSSTFGGIKRKTLELINRLFLKSRVNKKLASKLKEVDLKISQIKDGEQGTQGEGGIQGERGQQGLDGSPDTPTKVRNKLEDLTGNEKLKISAVRGLQKKLKELKERKPIYGGGGGFSKIAMDAHIISGEELGTGDGSETDFELVKAPNPISSLAVFVSVGRMWITEDFTLSGKTITFLIAPPTGAKVRADYRC